MRLPFQASCAMGTPMGKVIQTFRRKLDAFAAAFTVNIKGTKDSSHVIIPQHLLSGFCGGAWCNPRQA